MPIKVTMYVIRPEATFPTSSVWKEPYKIDLSRVPSVGEFIDIRLPNSPEDDWYKVTMVIHRPNDADNAANIFVEPVDYHEAFPHSDE
jgi:hypothetical protein